MMGRPRCVWCRKRNVEAAYRPFCSERCKRADLGRWLSGAYRVEGAPMTEADQDEGEDPSDGDHDPDLSTPH